MILMTAGTAPSAITLFRKTGNAARVNELTALLKDIPHS